MNYKNMLVIFTEYISFKLQNVSFLRKNEDVSVLLYLISFKVHPFIKTSISEAIHLKRSLKMHNIFPSKPPSSHLKKLI